MSEKVGNAFYLYQGNMDYNANRNRLVYSSMSVSYTHLDVYKRQDTIDFSFADAEYKIVTYVDSVGCTSCKLQLPRWKEFMHEVDSLVQGKVPFVFYFHPKDVKELRYITRRDVYKRQPLDFDLSDTDSFVIPDYSGENRFSWADMAGNLLHKSHCIPITDEKRLQESAPAVAQGWRSFISFSPDKKLLVTVTQLGDVLDIYNIENGRHINYKGEDGEPEFQMCIRDSPAAIVNKEGISLGVFTPSL